MTEHPSPTSGATILSEAECWEFLRTQEFGRLAFHLDDEVHITPINYAVDHETLLFRTAVGHKLLAVMTNPDVAFAADFYDETTARSVIVRGRARVLPESESHRAENVPLRPWVAGETRYNVVEIAPATVSGRRFTLSKPWTHLAP